MYDLQNNIQFETMPSSNTENGDSKTHLYSVVTANDKIPGYTSMKLKTTF